MRQFAIILALLLCLVACEKKTPLQPPTPSIAATTPKRQATYVGSEQCQVCHQTEQQQWLNSHHHKAMMTANKNSVEGNFSAPPLKHHRQETLFSASKDYYQITTDQNTTSAATLDIQYTFGIFPLQQYLTALPGGRWQSLPFAWDSRPTAQGGQRWFHLYADENIVPGDVLHWRSLSHNANHMCIECHTTDFKKNYNNTDNTFQSTWVETGVGCESCHGPGSEHLAWTKTPTDLSYQNKGWSTVLTAGSLALWKPQTATEKPARTEPANSTQVERCAQCHSRRSRIASNNDDKHFLDAFMPALLDESLYFPDGQIQDEDYEYGSFLQSKMAQHGVTCSNCHNPHSGKVKIEGNGLCLQCHSADHDTPAHTQHPRGSAGSFCIDCHMPTRTYMTVDARRDHSMRVPRPDLSASLHTPNACTNCHTDKTAEWATNALEKQRGNTWKKPHYGTIIYQARLARPEYYDALLQLIQDPSQPTIVRATAISLLGNYPTRNPSATLTSAFNDNEALIRLAALRIADALPPEQQTILLPLLQDNIRAIRIEAARVLTGNPVTQGDIAFEKAKQEYIESQQINAETAASLTNLATLAMRERRIEEAEKLLKKAIQQEPYYIPASINLADLYRMQQRESDAGDVLQRATRIVPDNADLMLSYALWLVRHQDISKATSVLQQITQNSSDPHTIYLYALALSQQGQTDAALNTLDKAASLPIYNRDVQLARINIALQAAQPERAKSYIKQWQKIDPQDPALQSLSRK